MTSISERTGQLGTTVGVKTEEGKDGEKIPVCEIQIGGLMLEANDVNALLEDPYAHQALFTSKGGHLEPALPQVENLVLREKRTNVDVTITIETTGPAKPQTLRGCMLKNLQIAPMSGGLTALGFKVQTKGKHVPELVGLLTAHLDGHISCEVRPGAEDKPGKRKPKQRDLPINTFGDGEQPENSRTGRLINLSARRAAKKAKKTVRPFTDDDGPRAA
jgi:hypothetical protein